MDNCNEFRKDIIGLTIFILILNIAIFAITLSALNSINEHIGAISKIKDNCDEL